MERIWDYYKRISAETSYDSEGKMLNYGLDFFFAYSQADRLNTLTKAFLGDEGARSRLNGMRAPAPSDSQLLRYCSSVTPPYPAQLEAIRRAISEPVSLVQGPPGTGKTETILNLIACIRGLHPEATIAVVSCNNEALANIADKIREGSAHDPVLAGLSEQFSVLGAKAKIRACVSGLRDRGENTGFYDKKHCKLNVSFLRTRPVFTSTIHSLRKIFYTGLDTPVTVFDYVIADECSQCTLLLGMLALNSARNITLFGDNMQLPPIYRRDVMEPLRREFEDIPEEYFEEDGKSFLHACEEVFGRDVSSVLLDRHFRCHPSIIGFCNENVYGGRLNVMTRGGSECRIRVLWYEGDYYENADPLDSSDNLNIRQIELFMREELPALRERLRREPGLSVCVLAPFRAELEKLRERLTALSIEEFGESVLETPDSYTNKIPQLTIHKAQGRGYDIVYFLSTEDCSYSSRFPWSQKMRMINVAVSRAKKEFRLIAALQWLPPELQQRYAGYTLPLLHPQSPDEEQLFITKLIGYTAAHSTPSDEAEGFGLQRSAYRSIFDSVPRLRMNNSCQASAPELCLWEAIKPLAERYGLLVGTELPLRALLPAAAVTAEQLEGFEVPADELLQYREFSRLDLVLYDRAGRVRAVIEVDGGYHRSDPDVMAADRKKDIWLNEVLAGQTSFLRLPTDGSGFDEIEQIQALLSPGRAIQADLTMLERSSLNAQTQARTYSLIKALIEDRNTRLTACAESVRRALANDADGSLARSIRLSYENSSEIDDIPYDDLFTEQFYLCRYDTAYTFEYTVILGLALQLCRARDIGLLTFGCGSMNDAWAAAYANAAISSRDSRFSGRTLRYTGVDIVKWRIRSAEPDGTDGRVFHGAVRDCFGSFGFCRCRFSDLLGMPRPLYQQGMAEDIIFLPKVINELGEDEFRSFARGLGSFRFPKDEYFLCVSHSRTDMVRGIERVAEIAAAINSAGEFDVTYDLDEMFRAAAVRDPLRKILPEGGDTLVSTNDPDSAPLLADIPRSHRLPDLPACYLFRSSANEIPRRTSDLLPDVAFCGTDTLLRDFGLRNSITTVKYAAFQIVRLTRR